MRARNRDRARAFTLVELLVVISIIALLISLLLPVLSSARTAAQLSQSLANLRQISTATYGYANDSKDSLPLATNRLNGSNVGIPPTWAGMLRQAEYVNTVKIFWSPARDTSAYSSVIPYMENYYSGNNVTVGSVTGIDINAGYNRTGYGCNTYLMPEMHDTRAPATLSGAKVPQHSSVITYTEAWSRNNGPMGSYKLTATTLNTSATTRVFTMMGGLAARSYLDGHAIADSARNIGWNATDQYEGTWTYTSANSMKPAPWFNLWWQ